MYYFASGAIAERGNLFIRQSGKYIKVESTPGRELLSRFVYQRMFFVIPTYRCANGEARGGQVNACLAVRQGLWLFATLKVFCHPRLLLRQRRGANLIIKSKDSHAGILKFD